MNGPPHTTKADTPVLLERRDAVLLITLNRPRVRNAFNIALAERLGDALDLVEDDEEIRAAVITGEGHGFSSGMDLKAFAAGEDVWNGLGNRGGMRRVLTECASTPLIAAVEGFAVAGGLELALVCDVIVAGRSAHLGIPEVQRSLVAAGGALRQLPLRIGPGRAARLALTGDTITAEEGDRIGLVDELVDDGSALSASLAIAARIAANDPAAVGAASEILRGQGDWTRQEFWERQAEIASPVNGSERAVQGAENFASDDRSKS